MSGFTYGLDGPSNWQLPTDVPYPNSNPLLFTTRGLNGSPLVYEGGWNGNPSISVLASMDPNRITPWTNSGIWDGGLLSDRVTLLNGAGSISIEGHSVDEVNPGSVIQAGGINSLVVDPWETEPLLTRGVEVWSSPCNVISNSEGLQPWRMTYGVESMPMANPHLQITAGLGDALANSPGGPSIGAQMNGLGTLPITLDGLWIGRQEILHGGYPSPVPGSLHDILTATFPPTTEEHLEEHKSRIERLEEDVAQEDADLRRINCALAEERKMRIKAEKAAQNAQAQDSERFKALETAVTYSERDLSNACTNIARIDGEVTMLREVYEGNDEPDFLN